MPNTAAMLSVRERQRERERRGGGGGCSAEIFQRAHSQPHAQREREREGERESEGGGGTQTERWGRNKDSERGEGGRNEIKAGENMIRMERGRRMEALRKKKRETLAYDVWEFPGSLSA